MEMIIQRDCKEASCYSLSPVEAGWLGFNFAKNHRDLVEDGWELRYFGHSSNSSDAVNTGTPGTAPRAAGILADLIKNPPKHCDHECPEHPKCCV